MDLLTSFCLRRIAFDLTNLVRFLRDSWEEVAEGGGNLLPVSLCDYIVNCQYDNARYKL